MRTSASFAGDSFSRTRVPSARARQTSWFWYGGFITLYGFFFWIWPVQPVPEELLFANVILVAVCCFPLARWRAQGSHNLPMFELICLFYGVDFGLVAQLLPNSIIIMSRRIEFGWDTLLQATWLATLGVSALIIGYDLVKRTRLRLAVAPMDLPLNTHRITYYLIATPILTLCFALLQSSGSAFGGQQFGALIGLLSSQLYLSLVILAYWHFDAGRRTPLITFLFFFSLLLALGLGLNTGFLERAAAPVALVMIVRWHCSRKFPWKAVVPLLLIFAVLNFVKGAYREQAWYGEQRGFTERLVLWWTLASESATTIASQGDDEADDETGADVGDALWARFDLVHKFAWVLTKTPADVPHYQGSTYSYLLYGWIPRFIWPEKPIASAGYQTDVDYQFISPSSVGATNIGIGFLVEAFANFGAWGVFGVMALQGACFAFLDRLLNGPRSEGGRAIYMAVMFFFLNGLGSNTVTLFGALLQIVVANGIILRMFATGWRVNTPSLRRSLPVTSR